MVITLLTICNYGLQVDSPVAFDLFLTGDTDDQRAANHYYKRRTFRGRTYENGLEQGG